MKKTDFDKFIDSVKRIVIGSTKLEIPNNVLQRIDSLLGFFVTISTPRENVTVQTLDSYSEIVDDVFVLDYVRNPSNRKHIKNSLILKSDFSDVKKVELLCKEIILMIHETYENDKYTIPHLIGKKETQKELLDWDELYIYVKYHVLKYDVSQLLEPQIIQKIRELQTGRIYGNLRHQKTCDYSYSDILLTFKFCYFDISTSTRFKHFDNNVQKFAYICAIVKNNLNTVIDKRKAQEEADKNIGVSDIMLVNKDKPEYSARKDKYRSNKECLPELEHLW